MITNTKMNHILQVARKCYEIAKTEYLLTEEECRKAFLIGFLHDIGYEFCENIREHPHIGFNLLYNSFGISVEEIKNHGNPENEQTLFLEILNQADMSVDAKGNIISVKERLEDIKYRYGENSIQFKNATKLVNNMKLI